MTTFTASAAPVVTPRTAATKNEVCQNVVASAPGIVPILIAPLSVANPAFPMSMFLFPLMLNPEAGPSAMFNEPVLLLRASWPTAVFF